MPVCPNCEYEYVKGMTYCPDCGVALVDENLITKPEDWTEEGWVVVYTSYAEYEIEMLKDNLESAGIDAAVLSQKDRNFPAPGDLTIVKLLVKREDLNAALSFIDKLKSESSEEEEDQ